MPPPYPDGGGEQDPGGSDLPRGAVETGPDKAHSGHMADPEEEPVMLPFQDKTGTGWHVVIRYHQGHERRVDGFATQDEALAWIIANAKQVDQQPP